VLPSAQLPQETPSPSPSPKKKKNDTDGDANGEPNDSGSGSAGGSTAPRTVGGVSDGSGDAGLQAPAYADLATVSIVDTGRARIVVDVGAGFPGRLAAGEVMGVGVDLYRGNGTESDYQVFADGSSEGWFAYLQTPGGFVEFPGTFLIGGRRMVFEVPWASIGAPPAGSFRSFIDWSKKATPINQFGQDLSPNSGKAPFRR
jgi:hypothetical protein